MNKGAGQSYIGRGDEMFTASVTPSTTQKLPLGWQPSTDLIAETTDHARRAAGALQGDEGLKSSTPSTMAAMRCAGPAY